MSAQGADCLKEISSSVMSNGATTLGSSNYQKRNGKGAAWTVLLGQEQIHGCPRLRAHKCKLVVSRPVGSSIRADQRVRLMFGGGLMFGRELESPWILSSQRDTPKLNVLTICYLYDH